MHFVKNVLFPLILLISLSSHNEDYFIQLMLFYTFSRENLRDSVLFPIKYNLTGWFVFNLPYISMLIIYFYLNHDFFSFFISTITDFSEFYGKEKQHSLEEFIVKEWIIEMVRLGTRHGTHPTLPSILGFWQKETWLQIYPPSMKCIRLHII